MLRLMSDISLTAEARLAQSVEHETLNLRVVGSSPTLGATFCRFSPSLPMLSQSNDMMRDSDERGIELYLGLYL